MKAFLDKNFLLSTATARSLYHNYAAQMPIAVPTRCGFTQLSMMTGPMTAQAHAAAPSMPRENSRIGKDGANAPRIDPATIAADAQSVTLNGPFFWHSRLTGMDMTTPMSR